MYVYKLPPCICMYALGIYMPTAHYTTGHDATTPDKKIV